MSAEGYAGFLKDMGHIVRQDGDIWWFNAHPHIYMSFPFDRPVDPYQIDRSLVLGRDGWAARFPTEPDLGKPSYRIACTDQDYGMSTLLQRPRNQTRRGLEACECRPLAWEDLAEKGMSLNIGTLKRQGRRIDSDIESFWHRYYQAAAKAEGAETWGAFQDGELAAYLISFVMENTAHILIVRSDPDKLKFYPNNALIYSYLSHSLKERGLGEVSFGLESIQAGMGNLERFKRGMGFAQIPIGQRIILKPGMKLIANRPVSRLVTGAVSRFSSPEKAEKLAGLIDWYQQQPSLP